MAQPDADVDLSAFSSGSRIHLPPRRDWEPESRPSKRFFVLFEGRVSSAGVTLELESRSR